MLQSSQLLKAEMQTAARFAKSSAELDRIARINVVGLDACFSYYNEGPTEEKAAEMLADSLALAMRQAFYLNKELLILAIGTEMENAHSELNTIVSPKQTSGQLDLFA